MNAIKAEESSCRVSHCVSLYADGELDPNRSLEVEIHLAVCASCRDELEATRAIRRSLRRSTMRQLPKGFEERMRLVSISESAEIDTTAKDVDSNHAASSHAVAAVPSQLVLGKESDEPSSVRVRSQVSSERASRRLGRRDFGRFRISWGTAMAMAAAASFVVAFFATRTDRPDSVARMPVLKSASLMNAIAPTSEVGEEDSFDQLIDRLVSLHAHPVPPETKNFDEAVDRFNGTLGVGLDRRQLRQPFGANFSGARMHVIEFREPDIEPTAELRYTMQGHRITLYVFDPRRVPIGLTHLSRRVVRSAPIYVGQVRGFSVAASENGGVGYAMASDLDSDKSAQLVAQIH